MNKTETIKQAAGTLGLANIKANIDIMLKQAEEKNLTYTEFMDNVLEDELFVAATA